MKDTKKHPACTEKMVVVHQRDLPLSCPTNDMTLWNAHPKVYLPIEATGRIVCPYCSTQFILQHD
jgi:uncharacterized Zn-finger protein